ncbi:phosphatase PAP2 family protein [Streptomyces sp. NPDC001922]|uniref:phosphatase PAP2 family protein n=1 Tax=Streptomyces sp. NPDC001922 TaxID=3364624 RepID=UPI0036C3423A
MDAPPPSPPDGLSTPSRPGARCLLRTAALCGLLSGVLLVLVVADWAPLTATDRDVADDLHGSAVHSPGWTRTSRILTDWFWDPWTFRALLVAAGLLLLWRGFRVAALWLLLVTLAGSALQQGVKFAVGRERPQWPDPVATAHYTSFPSGHAMTAALGCCLLLWLLAAWGVRGRWLRVAVAVAVVSVLGVGFTRLYLGVHWLSDVLAGWLLGVALAALAVAALPRCQAVANRRKVPLSGGE